MKFATFPLEDAEHTVLAHAVTVPEQVLRKGHVLTRDDVARLRSAGITTVTAAKLAPDDIHEDRAAQTIADAAASSGQNIRRQAPFTGRANIVATAQGLLVLDRQRLDALNAGDERITIATLEPYAVVSPGTLVATIKIIPFAVPAAVLETSLAALAGERPAIEVAAFQPKRIALILSALPNTKPSIIEKRRQVIAGRLTDRAATLINAATVAHSEQALSKALLTAKSQNPDLILIFAATAIVDRDDTVPMAVRQAGATIIRLGMPVDPGNLLLLAELNQTPVVGVPSCAASPKLNGFDWVLDRLLASLPVSTHDIAAMGVGGLLKEIPSRPQPRAGAVIAHERQAPRIAALVLAAGRSSRMGDDHKLLQELDGKPLVRHIVETLTKSSAHPIKVVLGHRAHDVREALASLHVEFVDNDEFAEGIASSIRAGIRALPKDVDGALIALGDMPNLTATDIDRLIAAFSPDDGRSIVTPTRGAKRGNPITWARAYFDELLQLTGDQGAKRIIEAHPAQVVEVDLGTDAVLFDIDTPEALARERHRRAKAD